jgi:hypothetical protein
MNTNACAELCWVRTVQCSKVIDRPSSELFGIISSPLNDNVWMLGLTRTEQLTPGKMQEGTRMICRFGAGPLTLMKAHAVIEEFEPGRRFVRRRVGGKLAMAGEFLVEPSGGSSRVRWTMDVGLAIPLLDFLLNPLIAQWMKMSMAVSLNKLKALSEREQLSAGAVNDHVANAS